jgi:hypothetical protein
MGYSTVTPTLASLAWSSLLTAQSTLEVMREQLIHFVDIEAIELQLCSPATSDAVVEEFQRFGQVLFAECLQRGSEVDRKLTTMIGWSVAALASLLVKYSRTPVPDTLATSLLVAAAVSAFAGIALGSFAFKTRMWPTPSEKDWFREGLWDNVQTLKRYHVVSLLVAHQEHVRQTRTKADCLRRVELFLAFSAFAIGVLLFL